MKRGESGLSLVVGIDKPAGLTSHDIVNRCRGVFSERRVGHAGTLDPLAEGVLIVLIGPATRLSPYICDQSKRYRFDIVFGSGTDTDDAAGAIISTGRIFDELYDEAFARRCCEGLVGKILQMPPRYSAIKVDGKKSYAAARKGETVDLVPREIEIFDARLHGVSSFKQAHAAVWDVSVTATKGTYIRSLARDMGEHLGCPAHVGRLVRESSGRLERNECITLDELQAKREQAALDPLCCLDMQACFADDALCASIADGKPILTKDCTPFGIHEIPADKVPHDDSQNEEDSVSAFDDGELVAFVTETSLKALYEVRAGSGVLVPRCVFPIGVKRG